MKKNTKLTLTLVLFILSIQIPLISARKYLSRGNFVSSGFSDGQFTRVSLRSSPAFNDASEVNRLAYIKEQFFDRSNESLFGFYEDLDLTKDRTSDFIFKLSKNEALAKKQGNIFLSITPTKSTEYFKGGFVVYATPYTKTAFHTASPSPADDLEAPLIANTNCFELEIRAQWVPSINWESVSYHTFGIFKIFFNSLMIGITILKPFLPAHAKIHASWIAQTTIYWQLLMYTGLMTGLFGGVINQIQKGALRASREYFFLNLVPKFSESFLKEIEGFAIYKFLNSSLIAALTEETFIECLTLLIALITTFIVSFTENKKLYKICREVLSSISTFTMIPIVTFSFYSLYVYTLTDAYSGFWNITNLTLIIGFLTYFFMIIFRMINTVSSINYLHGRGVYQEGKVEIEQGSDLAFDSYVSMSTSVGLRVFEFLLMFFVCLAYPTSYEAQSLGCIAILLMWILSCLAIAHKLKHFQNGTPEREQTNKIIKTSLGFCILMSLQYVIFLMFWLITELSLSGVKIMTWIYIVLVLLTLVLLVGQAVLRIFSIRIVPDYLKDQKHQRIPQESHQNFRTENNEQMNDHGGNL